MLRRASGAPSEAGNYIRSFHNPSIFGGLLASLFTLPSTHWMLAKVVHTASDVEPDGNIEKDYLRPQHAVRTYASSPAFPVVCRAFMAHRLESKCLRSSLVHGIRCACTDHDASLPVTGGCGQKRHF
jgi:hypothetical protein